MPADGVERVEAVDAGLARDQVVHRVAVEVREEEPVGLVAAGHEAVDGDLVGVVDEDPVLHVALGAQQHLLRVARVADQLQVALLAPVDLAPPRGRCRRDADRVARAWPCRRPSGSCWKSQLLLLADRVGLVRALGLGGDRARLLGLRVGLGARGGGREQRDGQRRRCSEMRMTSSLSPTGRRRTSPPSPRPDGRRRGSGRASDPGCPRRSGP